MWRDDHIGDPAGAIFLGLDHDTRRRLVEYFGARVRILAVEVVHNQAHVDVEYVRLAGESDQLVTAAAEFRAKGLLKNAHAMLLESLALDPLNPDAFLALGVMLAERKDYPAALDHLRRAREAAGDRADILHALAGVSIQLDRVAAAIGYLQRAAELAPNDPAIRRALAAIDPRPAADSDAPSDDALTRNRRA